MSDRLPRESLVHATGLVRRGRLAEAIPFLDHAVTDKGLVYAPLVLKFVRLILDGHDTVEVAFDDRRFRFGLAAANLGLGIHHAGGRFFEEAELAAVRALVPKRSVIVDVGANVGNHAIFFAGLLAPSLVIPVEPVPDALNALRRNLALNGISVDERGFGLAAGRENGSLKIELEDLRDLVTARVGEIAPGDQTGSIPSIPLDDLVPERVDLLKIDVEGFEANVIAGAERILREDKPLLVIEAHDDKRESLLAQLAVLKYKPIRAFGGIGYQNIFLRVQF